MGTTRAPAATAATARHGAVAGPAVIWVRSVVILVLVFALVVPVTAEEERCRAGESLVQGDIVIHGLFPYLGGDDCTTVSQFGRQLETAAEWAVRRVNSHGVLRGGVLGLRSYPICTSSSSLTTVVTTQAYSDGADLSCVDGTFAGFLSPLLPAAAEALLSELPATRALVPTDGGAALVETLAELAAELGWTAVTLVTDDHGERAADLVEQLEYLGLCVTRWVTVTGRQLEAFSELSTLADGSCLVGMFELSELQLRQLGRLRCVLGLRRPEQLRLVPEGALVAFDAAAEVPELTETLRGRMASTEAWQATASEGTVTMTHRVAMEQRDETPTQVTDRDRTETNQSEVDIWKTMEDLERQSDDWPLVSGGQISKALAMTKYSSEEVEASDDELQSSTVLMELGPATSTVDRDLTVGSDITTHVTKPLPETRASTGISTAADITTEVQESTADGSKTTEEGDVKSEMNTVDQSTSTEPVTFNDVQDVTTEAAEITNAPTLSGTSSSTLQYFDSTAKTHTAINSSTTLGATFESTSTSTKPDTTNGIRTTAMQASSTTHTQSEPANPGSTTLSLDTSTSVSTLPTAWELTAPPTEHPLPFVANPAAIHVVRLVYNYARSLQLQLMRLCPSGACDAATALRRATDTYSDLGQEFVAGLDLTLTPGNLTVYLTGSGGPRPVGWRSGGSLRLPPDPALPSSPQPSAAVPCPALFTQPVQWQVSVWTTVLATLAAVGALACLFFLCFYAAVSCRRLEHGQGWMALLVVATLLQYAATAPFFLRRGRLVCALRLQAPALGLAAPLSVLLSRALCLAAAHTTRGDFGHVSGMLQITLCFFIFLVQVGISTERLHTLQWPDSTTPYSARCSHTPQQQLMALSYVILLQVLQFVLNPWVALCGRNYCEGPLSAVYTCLAVLLWSGALTLFYLEVPLLDSDSAAPQLCLGMIVLASVSLVVVHVPRVLLLTREVSGLGALPHLRRYQDRSASVLGDPMPHLQRYEQRSASALAGAAAIRQPRHRRDTVEINEAISLDHLDGVLTRAESAEDGRGLSSDGGDSHGGGRANHEFRPRSAGGERNHAFQPDDSVSVGDAETASAHSDNKYPTSEM